MVRIGPSFGAQPTPPSKEPEGKTSFQISSIPSRGASSEPQLDPKQRIDATIAKMQQLYSDYLAKISKTPPESITDIGSLIALLEETLKEFTDGIGAIPSDRTHLDNAVNEIRAAIGEFFTQKDHPKTFAQNMLVHVQMAINELKAIKYP